MHKVVAIIPARGGSKGLPGKNIRDLCGKPLIAYSIEGAMKIRTIDRVIVSTDDEEIAAVSKACGAEVPFLRPSKMAQDHSSVGEAVVYTLKKIREGGYFPDVYVVFYPTHPFRPIKLIDTLIQKCLEGHSPVDTVKRVICNVLDLYSIQGDNSLSPIIKNVSDQTAHQNGKCFFRPYGLFHGQNTGSVNASSYIHVVDDPVSLIDIDTLADFYLAEEVLRAGLFVPS